MMFPDQKPPPWFEQDLKRILPRLRLAWRRWKAPKGDRRGDTVWSPFGPPLLRATDLDGKVCIRMQFGKLPDSDVSGWVQVFPDRATPGRWVIYEDFDGQSIKVFDICDADSGPIPLDNRTLEAIHECYDVIEERQRLLQNQYQEAEVDVPTTTMHGNDGGPPIPTQVFRDAKQQAWRKEAEDKVRDLAAWEYNQRFAHYQTNPTKEPKGERHPAGFIVTDHRGPRDSA
jgi:hypothetical protein